MRRFLTLLLAIAIMLLLANGFAADGDTSYDEHLTITWAHAGIEDVEMNDAFSDYWFNRFNVTIKVIPMTYDSWEERLRIWINSGDMPDVANYSAYQYTETVDYAEQELIYRLPDGWQDRWTNVAQTQACVPSAAIVEENLGGTYLLFRPVFSIHKPVEKLSYHPLLYMRKDWMNAVGCEIKDTYTIDEITELARLIKENDPGALGSNLVPICIETTNMGGVLPVNIFTHSIEWPYYRGEDGLYTWGPADERTLEGLRIYKQWYDDGLLDPEFYTLEMSFGDQYRFYYEGNVGITIGDGIADMMKWFGEALGDIGLDPEESLHYAQLIGNDGLLHQAEQTNYWGSVIFSPNIGQAKFERAMDILDYSATLEGQEFINMGFKDIDWTIDENGDYVDLLADQGFEWVEDKYPSAASLWWTMLCLGDDFATVSPMTEKKFRDDSIKFYKLRDELGQDNSTFLDMNWEIAFYSSPALSQASMSLSSEYARLILMDGDIEENWRNWVNEKMMVVQPVLDELNSTFPAK